MREERTGDWRNFTRWREIKCSMFLVGDRLELVTSKEAEFGTGGSGISAQLMSLMVAGGRKGAQAGAGYVAAAGESDWAFHLEAGPSWPGCGWPRGASGRLNSGWLVPSASSSPCTEPKPSPSGQVGVGQLEDYPSGAQGQVGGFGSHPCWSLGRVQTGPGPLRLHSPAGPRRPWVTSEAEPAARVERYPGASGGLLPHPLAPSCHSCQR